MRTKEEILAELAKCRMCGSRTPNTAGECMCSYDIVEIPLELEILLDIRDLLLEQKQSNINKATELPTLLHASCTDNTRIT